MFRSSSRAKRNQQILFMILSILMVVSMGISLVATITPGPPPVTPTLRPTITLSLTPTPEVQLTSTPGL